LRAPTRLALPHCLERGRIGDDVRRCLALRNARHLTGQRLTGPRTLLGLVRAPTIISDCFNQHVLLDHIPHDDDGCRNNDMFKVDVTIPDVDCKHCVLQLTQMMTDKSQERCNGSLPEHWGIPMLSLQKQYSGIFWLTSSGLTMEHTRAQ